jgi:acetolactate synthase-1/2/3 large subunit
MITATPTKTNLSHHFTKLLKAHHINHTFTTGQPLPFLTDQPDFPVTSLVHDQATVHAADGYSRATGAVGVCFLYNHQAIPSAITAIATAKLDSVPLVILLQSSEHESRMSADPFSMTQALIKDYVRVSDKGELLPRIDASLKLAKTGRPGIVIVDVDFQLFNAESDSTCKLIDDSVSSSTKQIKADKMAEILTALKEAKQPVILVGGGTLIGNASPELDYFIKQTSIPFVSTLMGLGAIDEDHPLHLGMVGMHGTYSANRAVHKADLLICLGVRFSDRITGKIKGFSPHSKKIQIDIDPAEINKLIPVELPIIGDVKNVLAELNQQALPKALDTWQTEACSWRQTSAKFHKVTHKLLDPSIILTTLQQEAQPDCVVATDVGQHQMWTAHHFRLRNPRQFLTSGGFGTMGYGLPAAIGGARKKPNQQVILVTGDGSFQMNLQELVTVSRERLNIKIAIFQNGYLGMVRQWQQLFYQRQYSEVKISSPDFTSLASSYGINSGHAHTIEEAQALIKRAVATDGPFVMTFTIEDEKNVYPIVPPGGSNTEALLDGE